MKIAILGSVALRVPPTRQGGTEWVAYYQARGLAKLGHEVTLIAAEGSLEEGYKLVEIGLNSNDKIPASVKTSAGRQNSNQIQNSNYINQNTVNIESSRGLRLENVKLAEVIQKLIDLKDEYAVILNNMRGEAVFIPIAKMLGKPFVNVMHLPMFEELAGIFRHYNNPIITISNNQRKEFPDLNYLATVYNCVDTEKYFFNPRPRPEDDYLLMLGTIGRHKNQGAAIRVAKKLGMKLILAGKIRDQDYFDELKKDIDGKNIIWYGELDFNKKIELYQNAKAFLFPILWEEPFGLVMIEAMACGTPVVAFANGAIPEVVVNGKTGFVIDNNSEEKMAEAVKKIDSISRQDCRNHVTENFSVEKMVAGYEEAMGKVISH